MIGLLTKDILVVSKQLKLFLIVIPVMALSGGALTVLAIFLGAALPMTAIAYDERSRWNELAAVMPYSKRDIVLCKYVLGYVCMLAAASLTVAAQLVLALMGNGSISEGLSMLLPAVAGGLCYIAISMPILFRFGSEKGRFVYIVLMALVGGLGMINQSTGFLNMLGYALSSMPALTLAAAAAMNAISVYISMRIKAN